MVKRRKTRKKTGTTVGYMRLRGLIAAIMKDVTTGGKGFGNPIAALQQGDYSQGLQGIAANMDDPEPLRGLVSVALVGGVLTRLKMNPSIVRVGKTSIRAF